MLSAVIQAVRAEALVVHALRALQSLATAAGVLGLQDVILATLSTICSFTNPAPLPAAPTPAAPLSATASPAPAPSPAAAAAVTPEPLRTATSGGTLPPTPALLDSAASLPEASSQEMLSPMSRVAASSRPSATCAPAHPPCHRCPAPAVCILLTLPLARNLQASSIGLAMLAHSRLLCCSSAGHCAQRGLLPDLTSTTYGIQHERSMRCRRMSVHPSSWRQQPRRSPWHGMGHRNTSTPYKTTYCILTDQGR